MYNWMKWLRLLGGWHFIAATAIKPPKAACQFAADDILLYEFCYYNPMDLLHHLEKGKKELSPLQYHIKPLHIISRHYKKSLLRSQIYHGYEELSSDTNYPIWRRQKEEASMRCSLLHGSWDQILQRCPSVRLSACGQNRVRFVSSTIFIGSISYLHILSSNFRRRVACNARYKIYKFEILAIFLKLVILTLSPFDLGSNMTQWYG